MKQNEIQGGAGPWKFGPDSDLGPGDFYLLDFRNMEYNGKRGWFRKYLPLDIAQITNESNVAVDVVFNEQYEDVCIGNNVETYDDTRFVQLKIVNTSGASTIAKEDVTITVEKEPYDQDDRARAQAGQSWLERAANDVIPGGIPGTK